MSPSITAVRVGATAGAGASTPAASGSESGASFAEALQKLVAGAEDNAENANSAVAGMLDKSVDVHDAMIALQRAEMSLQLAVQIRNKLVQAYQDIMRMPV